MSKIVLTVPANAVSVHVEMKGGSAGESGWVNLVFRDADDHVIQEVRAVGGTHERPMGDMILERHGAGGRVVAGGGVGGAVSAGGVGAAAGGYSPGTAIFVRSTSGGHGRPMPFTIPDGRPDRS